MYTFEALVLGTIFTISFVVLVIDIESTDGSYVQFKNIKCVSLDETSVTFRKCYLQVLGRGKIALNLHAELYQNLVSNVMINMQLLKKTSGYRPFLFNFECDFCASMAQLKRISFFSIIISSLQEKSNINHSCPYDHDIIVKEFVLEEQHFRLLPLPTGEYMLHLKVSFSDHKTADVKIYIEINEKL